MTVNSTANHWRKSSVCPNPVLGVLANRKRHVLGWNRNLTTHQASRPTNYFGSFKNVIQAYKEGLSIHRKRCGLQEICTTAKRISFIDVSRFPIFFLGGGGGSPQVSRACRSVKSDSEDEDNYEVVLDLYWMMKTEKLGQKTFPLPLCSPQISFGLGRHRFF